MDSASKPKHSSSLRDLRGVPITTTRPETVELLEHAIIGLCGHRADTGLRIERALEADAGLVPALCMQGFGLKCLGRRDLAKDAWARLRAAQHALAERGGSERERGLCAALESWCFDDPEGALGALDRVLRESPRDLLAFKLNHALHFMLGRSQGMRRASERALSAWDAALPGFGYVLGCHAFALEETADLDQAERVGRRAVELEPLDAWGAHAVAHVFEMRDQASAGLAWFDAVESQLHGCNNFAGHLAWHRALLHLQLGQRDQALALHDERIAIYPARDYRDLANASSLLWRLEREGVSITGRWDQWLEIARGRLGDHGLAFADAHHALVLTSAATPAEAQRFVTSMRDSTRERGGIEAQTLANVAVPLAEGMLALACGQPLRALDSMLPLRRTLCRIGGSHAQRDIFELLLIESALRSKQTNIAKALLQQRLALRPANRWALERIAMLGAARGRKTTPTERTDLRLGAARAA
jgi:tetratricopeptide (TPR) repeat protein